MSVRVRLWLLGSATVVVQAAVFPHLRLLGVVPDVGLLVAVSVAHRRGPIPGAAMGFGVGLAYDLYLETPLGMTAFAWCLTAWLFGAFHAGLVAQPRLLSPMIGAAAGVVSGVTFVAVAQIVGASEVGGTHALDVIWRVALYDALLAPLVFGAVGRLLPEQASLSARSW